MMTRNCIPWLVLAVLAGTGLSLHAAEFPMGNPVAVAQADTLEGTYADPVRQSEPGARSAFDGEAVSAGYVRGADASSAGVADTAPVVADGGAVVEFDSSAISRGVRTSIPSAAPSVPAKARAGNRWQSLVPGALK